MSEPALPKPPSPLQLRDELETMVLKELLEQFKGVRTHKRVSRPFLTLAESSCIVI
jgi:hypothetical protein